MEFGWKAEQKFVIHPSEGELGLIPKERNLCLEFRSVIDSRVCVLSEGKEIPFCKVYDKEEAVLQIKVEKHPVVEELVVRFEDRLEICSPSVEKRIYELVDQAEIAYNLKTQIMDLVRKEKSPLLLLSQFHALSVGAELYGALLEILTAREIDIRKE